VGSAYDGWCHIASFRGIESSKRSDWSRPLPAPLQIIDGDKPTLTLKTPGDVQNAIGVAGTISTKDDLGPCRGNAR